MPGVAQHRCPNQQYEIHRHKAGEDPAGTPVRPGPRLPLFPGEYAAQQQQNCDRQRRQRECQSLRNGKSPRRPRRRGQAPAHYPSRYNFNNILQQRRQGVINRPVVSGKRSGDPIIAQQPQRHRQTRNQRQTGAAPGALPQRRPRLKQQPQPHDHRHGHPDIPGLPGQGAKHRRPNQGGSFAPGQKLVGLYQGQGGQQDEQGAGQRPRRQFDHRNRQCNGQAGPQRQQAGLQPLPQVLPRNEYSQPQYDRVERPGDIPGIEHAQANGRQQQRVEGRPYCMRLPVKTVKTPSGQQIPGGTDVNYGIFVQRSPVGNLPRQRQGDAQRSNGRHQQGKSVRTPAPQSGGGARCRQFHSALPGEGEGEL